MNDMNGTTPELIEEAIKEWAHEIVEFVVSAAMTMMELGNKHKAVWFGRYGKLKKWIALMHSYIETWVPYRGKFQWIITVDSFVKTGFMQQITPKRMGGLYTKHAVDLVYFADDREGWNKEIMRGLEGPLRTELCQLQQKWRRATGQQDHIWMVEGVWQSGTWDRYYWHLDIAPYSWYCVFLFIPGR